jgi:hypothetical protein
MHSPHFIPGCLLHCFTLSHNVQVCELLSLEADNFIESARQFVIISLHELGSPTDGIVHLQQARVQPKAFIVELPNALLVDGDGLPQKMQIRANSVAVLFDLLHPRHVHPVHLLELANLPHPLRHVSANPLDPELAFADLRAVAIGIAKRLVCIHETGDSVTPTARNLIGNGGNPRAHVRVVAPDRLLLSLTVRGLVLLRETATFYDHDLFIQFVLTRKS